MSHILIIVPIVLVLFGAHFAVQRNMSTRYAYQCAKCGETFSLQPLKATLAPHRLGGAKFVKCPHCGRRSWVTPIRK
jgi:DNA-directed RNA polymerase subunit RPC12/RpoP